jgi:hypothetical protein
MSFVTPDFGLNRNQDSQILSPIIDFDDEGKVNSFIYAENVDSVRDPNIEEEEFSRNQVVLFNDGNRRLVLTSDGNIKEG